MEERVKEWQLSTYCGLNLWYDLHESWTEAVHSALKFLAGDIIGKNGECLVFYHKFFDVASPF